MITLKQFLNWLKPLIDYGYSISIGKIDQNKEKAICFYDDANSGDPVLAIGGIDLTSYDLKPIKILMRWTKNADTAETYARDIFQKLLGVSFFIDGKQCFIRLLCPQPIAIGTDDKGVYEYVIKLILIYER